MDGAATFDPQALVRGDQVHYSIYTDPAIFDLEMERIFGRAWVFVGHESEVPAPGDFKTEKIARWPLILNRAVDGQVRCFFNVCRHRGAKVCVVPKGNTKTFRCMYHGWTYNSFGALDGVPLGDRMRDLDMAENGLIPVPRLASHKGFVFVSMAKDGPSLAEHLGESARYIDMMVDRAPDREIEALTPLKYSYDGNWKFQIENYAENYHPAFLHQAALTGERDAIGARQGTRKLRDGYTTLLEQVFPGGHATADYQGSRGAMWLDPYDDDYFVALAARDGENHATMLRDLDMHITIWPNLMLHTRMNHYRVARPIAVNRTEIHAYPCRLKGASSAVNEGVARNTSEHCSASGRVQVDDMQAFNWMQEGLSSGAVDWLNVRLVGDQESEGAQGERQWIGASEETLRNQHRAWAAMMAG